MIAPAVHALSSLYVLARVFTCAPQPPPEVDLQFQEAPPVIINNKSARELGNFKSDTVFSHGANEVFTTGGLTFSKISSGFRFGYKTLTDPESGQGCIWLDKISLTVEYAPKVYIASGFRPGSCRYGVTATHEQRHVDTDVVTLHEYVPRVKQAVADAASSLGAQGPADKNGVARARDLFGSVLRTEMEKQLKEMERVRMMRQQAIDTRQEYLRLSKLCPGER